MRPHPDIYLVGLGMFELRQLTAEVDETLRAVSAIYHFCDKHDSLSQFCSRVYDLRSMYAKDWGEMDVYSGIAAYLVASANGKGPIAVAFDGNAMTYCTVAWKVASLGSEAGLQVEALPGVSCLDVLPIQLGFDPGDLGMQTLEASAMVRYDLALNPFLSTLLLQVGHFGISAASPQPRRDGAAFKPLISHLLRYYPADHPAVFIQTPLDRKEQTIVFTTEIQSIKEVGSSILSGMTLYLPRVGVPILPGTKSLSKEIINR